MFKFGRLNPGEGGDIRQAETEKFGIVQLPGLSSPLPHPHPSWHNKPHPRFSRLGNKAPSGTAQDGLILQMTTARSILVAFKVEEKRKNVLKKWIIVSNWFLFGVKMHSGHSHEKKFSSTVATFIEGTHPGYTHHFLGEKPFDSLLFILKSYQKL